MTKALEAKTDAVIESIREVHADTSGPARDNLDAIRRIIEEARVYEQMLESDCGEEEP